MAGDWMKIEKVTPDKPEVEAIACILDIDPDAVFGKCFRVWSWFDDHTVDGNAPSVSIALVDRKCGVSGFGAAMIQVGWLIEVDGGLTVPNFDRHCGKSAKNRALTAKRVAKHASKTNAPTNGKLTLDALPREEKRREEKSIKKGVAYFYEIVPKELRTKAFKEAWTDWIDHKHQKRQTYKETGAKRLLRRLAEMGPERASAAIDYSIGNNYAGIFEPSQNGNGKHEPQPPAYPDLAELD